MADLPTLRTSERSAFKRCVFRWYLEYRMGYRQRSPQADALWFGIGVHEALAQWYLKGKKRGPHPADTFEEWAGEEINFARTYLDETFDEPVWVDAKELGIAMLEQYIAYYGRDSQWEVIATEQEFRVRIMHDRTPLAYFASRWDGVVRDLSDGNIYLAEHKTASQIVTAYLELDDQGGSYWAVASQLLQRQGILRPDEHIAGIIYNFLRKALPDERPQNADGMYLNKDNSVSKRQPPPAFVRTVVERSPKEQNTQLTRIADEVAVMNAVRHGTIPITKTPTKDCPRCPFWIPCTLHERGNKHAFDEVMKNNYRQENPYGDMRKSA